MFDRLGHAIVLSLSLIVLPIKLHAQTADTPPVPKQPLEFLPTDYPMKALFEGEGGPVTLNLHIGPDGRVAMADIISTSGSQDLDEAAVQVAKTRWLFEPAAHVSELSATAIWKLPLTPVYQYRLDPSDLPPPGTSIELIPPEATTSHEIRPSDFSTGGLTIYNAGSGTTRLKYLILEDGSVGDTKTLVTSRARALDNLAINIIKARWKFKPATLNGKPVKYWDYVTFSFFAGTGVASSEAALCASEAFISDGPYSLELHIAQDGTVDDILFHATHDWMRFDAELIQQYAQLHHFPPYLEEGRPASCWRNPTQISMDRGNLALKGENYATAIRNFSQAIEVNSYYPQAYSSRAYAYRKMNQFSQAKADYETTITLAPNDAETLNEACFQMAAMDMSHDAIPYCNKSLLLRPDDADTLDSLGYAYFKLGDYTRAIEDYDAAILKNPQFAISLFGRGVAKLRLGDKSGNEDVAAAREINPNIADSAATIGITPP